MRQTRPARWSRSVVLAVATAVASASVVNAQPDTQLRVDPGRDAGARYPLDGADDLSLQKVLRPPNHGVKLVEPRNAEQAYPVRINGWWGLMDRRGQLVVYPRYDWIDRPTQSLARAVRDGRTGYINVTGREQIPLRYPWADRFAESYAVVGNGGGKFGYIDRRGKLIVPVKLDGALRFREGYAAVRVGDRCGFINVRGDAAIKPTWAAVRSFHDGLAAVRAFDPDTGEPGRWAYINKRGDVVFRDRTGRIERLGDFNDGLARVQARLEIDGETRLRWGYINRRFDWLIKPRYAAARDFQNGAAAVAVQAPVDDGADDVQIKWGLINARGDFTVPPVLDAMDDLEETLVLIEYDGRLGYTNRNASVGVRPRLRRALPFDDELARVEPEGLGVTGFAYIDTSGRVVWDPRRPHVAILDATNRGLATALTDRHERGSPRLELPPEREPLPEPYAPEFLYEEQLPRPEDVSPFQDRWR